MLQRERRMALYVKFFCFDSDRKWFIDIWQESGHRYKIYIYKYKIYIHKYKIYTNKYKIYIYKYKMYIHRYKIYLKSVYFLQNFVLLLTNPNQSTNWLNPGSYFSTCVSTSIVTCSIVFGVFYSKKPHFGHILRTPSYISVLRIETRKSLNPIKYLNTFLIQFAF